MRRYDPDQGNTFAAYATTRIRGAILDELRRMDWCPRRARARARKIKEAINALEQRLGRAATEEEICAELGLTPKDYANWLEESRPVTFIAIDQTDRRGRAPRGIAARAPCRRDRRDRAAKRWKSRSCCNFSLNESPNCPIYPGRSSPCITSRTCGWPKSPRFSA